MKIALFGRNFNENFNTVIYNLLTKLFDKNIEVFIYKPFHQFLHDQKKFAFTFSGSYDQYENLPKDVDLLISIGGDGTFLEAITLIRDSGIPIIGINSGRLGFLANIAGNEADSAIDYLISGKYCLEERALLQVISEQDVFSDFPFALNECTIQKSGSSLTTIHVTINGEYLTSYWADGLIISTPTGSTAYSLSVGGPIVTPESGNFIITPIAAHNLNVRPLIIPDSASLSLTVEGRTNTFMATLDSRSMKCDIINKINISKASFPVRMIKLPHINFYTTLRNKLMWGADKRN
jgi:NAD+ kinase